MYNNLDFSSVIIPRYSPRLLRNIQLASKRYYLLYQFMCFYFYLSVPSQQPAPYATVISSRILNIKWNNPDNPNGVIIRFELYRNGTLIYKGLQRDFNDTRLTPNTYYYYYILTYTDKGHTRSFQDNRVYKTPEDRPQNIDPPRITDIKARTATVSWNKPNITNGVIIQYRLVSVNSRNPSEVEHCRGLIFSCDLSNLKPFTTYNFTVVACNSGGCGRSRPRNVTTRQAAPDFQPMPNITLVPGGRALIVYWGEPPFPNGKVLITIILQISIPLRHGLQPFAL